MGFNELDLNFKVIDLFSFNGRHYVMDQFNSQ